MKTCPALLLWAAVCAAAGTLQAQTQTAVRVTADNVNLRAKPQLTAEVVAQVRYDERLAAYELGEEWIAVAVPAAADLWVMKSYVQAPQNTIGANRVNVRAGPGINYNIVATLELGEKVEPRGEEIQEWLKIAPPASARLWVSREFIEVLPEAVAAAPSGEEPKAGKKSARKKKGQAEEPAVAVAAVPAAEASAPVPASGVPTPIVSPSVPVKDAAGREIPVPPPTDLKLIPLEGQGRLAEVEGELRAAPLLNEAPTRYRVVRWQNNRWQILCHVYGEAAKFRSLQDQRVRVKGREYWIQGAAAPVLVPDEVQEIPAPAE